VVYTCGSSYLTYDIRDNVMQCINYRVIINNMLSTWTLLYVDTAFDGVGKKVVINNVIVYFDKCL